MTGPIQPKHLELKKDTALIVTWDDGRVSIFPIAYLRRMSPSADAKAIREEMERNPLTVLPASKASGPLTATGAEMVGNYAIKILFSDGHDTGLYSWPYLREIDPENQKAKKTPRTLPGAAGGAGGAAQ
jgi:DUF971 family protein